MKYALILFSFVLFSTSLFAQETELDSLKSELAKLKQRVEKLEKFQGPGYSENYYEDISHAFIVVSYHQGSHRISDSTSSIDNYGVGLQYAEDEISIMLNASWGGDKFFSSFYIGYNFYGKEDRVAITPLIGGISYGNNFLDVRRTIWSFGVSVTGLNKIPLSLAFFKDDAGLSFNVGYKFDIKNLF